MQLSEIYPSPSGADYEWVEIHNTSEVTIDLSSIRVLDATGKKLHLPSGSIAPDDYAIATSTAVLNNADERVILQSISGEQLDIATYEGKIESNAVWVRCPRNWTQSVIITKSASNDPACIESTGAPSPTPSIVPTVVGPTPIPNTPEPTSVPQVSLSEIFPIPESHETEWIELLNREDHEITLTNWYVDDGEGAGSSPFVFSTTIAPNGYAVIPLSRALLNNSGDTVRLMDARQNQVDSVTYTEAQPNYSFGKSDQEWCIQYSTPGKENEACIQPTSIPVEESPDPFTIGSLISTPESTLISSANRSVTQTPTPRKQKPTSYKHTYRIQPGDTQSLKFLRALGQVTGFAGTGIGILAIASIVATMKKRQSYEYDTL